MMNALEILRYEERMDALDAYSEKADRKAEEIADDLCDQFGLEGQERSDYWSKVYYAEYDRLMDEYEKTL